jgi:hypothetical protein
MHSGRKTVRPAVDPLSQRHDRIPHDWLYLPMHGVTYGSDAAAAVHDVGFAFNNGKSRTSPILAAADIALTGTATNIWDNPGALTPPAAGGVHALESASADLATLFRLSDLVGLGGVVMAFRLYVGASPSAREYIIAHSNNSTVIGGWAVTLGSSRKIEILMRPQNSGTSSTITLNTAPLATGQYHNILLHLNVKSNAIHCYLNGEPDLSQQMIADQAVLPLCGITSGGMLGLFRFPATGTALNVLGASATPSQARISDLWMFRCLRDMAPEIAGIARAFHTNMQTVPKGLLS